jgi:hypothetical protein
MPGLSACYDPEPKEVAVGGSLEPILSPRSLAVIGASSRADSLSGKLLGNLLAAGYTGAVFWG